MPDVEKLGLLVSFEIDFGGLIEVELISGEKHNVRADLFESQAFTPLMVKHVLVKCGKRAGGMVEFRGRWLLANDFLAGPAKCSTFGQAMTYFMVFFMTPAAPI